MVLHQHTPYWAVANNIATEPGSESLLCAEWNTSSSLNWIGISGVPSTACTWAGGTTTDVRPNDTQAHTFYGLPNSIASMSTTESSVAITAGQTVTLTNLTVYVSVSIRGHRTHTGTWAFNVVVDGVSTGASCTLAGVVTDPRDNSELALYCSADLDVFVAANARISVSSLWNASQHNNDRAENDIDWTLSYSLGAPLN
jgi:hypothetical protein